MKGFLKTLNVRRSDEVKTRNNDLIEWYQLQIEAGHTASSRLYLLQFHFVRRAP